ncbi:MAG TPA: GNAT family N-acetyltransferase [Solirubrobacteraceae bacterium]|jgi:GNAT superfamily N-acetyltransferase|nr:GNAT family N-acetyltransferase [Solirubrobacteraceae bacterium]
MSSSAPTSVPSHAQSWIIRRATSEDVGGIVVAVQELLLELGAIPPSAGALEHVAHELVDDRNVGAVLVARARGDVVGMLAASWQLAMHVPGRYALIQDLWVHRAWRNRAIGADLMTGLVELAREQGIVRVEVGLPRKTFAGLEATVRFYGDQGFTALGQRMRRVLT